MRVLQIIAAAMLALLCALAPARAKSVALVIGNDHYANLPASEQLQKAVNDARAVGAALMRIGFDVITGENLGRGALLGKLNDLIQRLAPGDTAFFFFSGHGIALDSGNYILPADVPDVAAGQETRLKGEALSERYIVDELTGRGVRVAVLVLDACRTNPFARSGKGIGGDKGLAPPPQAKGVFSLYAASSGQAARDRLHDGDPSPNSVFSRVLAPALTKPGLDLTGLAFDVREEVARVAKTAGYVQEPSYYDGTIGGRVYLAGPPPDGGRPGSHSVAEAAPVWEAVKNATSLAAVDDFIVQYGDVPVYGPLARARRQELAKLAEPPPAPPPLSMAPLTVHQEHGLQRGDSFRECASCPEMVVVPAGRFMMGSPEGERDRSSSEGPQHAVAVGKPFAVGRLHVTVEQFDAFVRDARYAASSKCWTFEGGKGEERAGRSWRNPGFAQEVTHPVVCVSWNDAMAYVDWLAQKTGKPYRLPSEAESEYAARGQTSPGAYPRYWFGNDDKAFCQNGNGADQKARDIPGWDGSWKTVPCNDGFAYTSPSGHYTPNAFGLYDVAGNVWQWTADCWHSDYSGAPSDGSAWTTSGCRRHVVRGGAWFDDRIVLRASARAWDSGTFNYFGFRLARTLVP